MSALGHEPLRQPPTQPTAMYIDLRKSTRARRARQAIKAKASHQTPQEPVHEARGESPVLALLLGLAIILTPATVLWLAELAR